jgi:hypothetical protein
VIQRGASHGVFPSKPRLLFTIPPPSLFIETIIEPITRISTFSAPRFVLKMVNFGFESRNNYRLFAGGGIRNCTEHMADVLLTNVFGNIEKCRSLTLFDGTLRNFNIFIFFTITAAAIGWWRGWVVLNLTKKSESTYACIHEG